ncbi:hypothetical protein MPC4_10496 [Methylocella tundrae]|uniref:Uncharacterized protein n=1 Tax=Methylocella tundrae TaxID=227605 RepID=A0A8B6M2S0_METTU|nr:hypothetical protein MPC4_10496 [Methylocella tundrae]
MADNPNATSANPNATMANPNATTAASGSLIGHAEGQQQRSRNDNQQPFHANLPWVVTANSISLSSMRRIRIRARQFA